MHKVKPPVCTFWFLLDTAQLFVTVLRACMPNLHATEVKIFQALSHCIVRLMAEPGSGFWQCNSSLAPVLLGQKCSARGPSICMPCFHCAGAKHLHALASSITTLAGQSAMSLHGKSTLVRPAAQYNKSNQAYTSAWLAQALHELPHTAHNVGRAEQFW